MTLEMERAEAARVNVVLRTPQEVREDRRRAARRRDAALKVALVTLIWLVSVSLLFAWGITGPEKQPGTVSLAALLLVVLPFVAAVIATRNQLYFTGGVYVVLTLAMVLPALSMVRAGA
ncbi:MAG: hypothetical protein ABW000_21710 [Actinoplanes sp.]